MAIVVTSQRASQSLDGEAIVVQLNASDSAKLSSMNIGQKGTLSSSSKIGYICSIDLYGHSFKMNPQSYNFDLASSSTPGYLADGETITLE